jgi:hypothetical protein
MAPHMASGDTELGSIDAIDRSQEMKMKGTRLLSGQSYYLSGEYSIPSKSEIEVLIRLGDGVLCKSPGEGIITVSQKARPGEIPVSKLLDYVSVFDPRVDIMKWDGTYVLEENDDGPGTPLF